MPISPIAYLAFGHRAPSCTSALLRRRHIGEEIALGLEHSIPLLVSLTRPFPANEKRTTLSWRIWVGSPSLFI